MAQFMITYLGGEPPKSPEEGQKHFEEYKAWLGALGDAVVSPANPLKDTRCIAPDGTVTEGSKSSMSGFTVIEAASIDDAITMATSCPFLGINGTLEVSQMVKMPV